MISSSCLPPYNRFDRVPQHALQCGLPPEVDYNLAVTGQALHHNVSSPANAKNGGLSNGTASSRDSSVSYVTGDSQSTGSSQPDPSSVSSLDSLLSPTDSVVKQLSQDLYIEQTSPPPYNNHHDQASSLAVNSAPSRTNLPKKSAAAQQRVAEILQQSGKSEKPFDFPPAYASPQLELLKLHRLMRNHAPHLDMNKHSGTCFSCKNPISTSNLACQAMGQLYHTKCFTCSSCGRTLREKAFYCVQGKIYCEDDYMYSGFQQTIEKCHSCGHLIMDTILQALGRSYHPGCFRCASCNQCLDGIPFTVDIENNVYCIADFHRLFAPKCAACGLSIVPIDGTDETVRVVALDKDFHIDCYHCEKCKIQLTDEPDKRCYPIGDRLLCYNCHIDVRGLRVSSPGASSSSSHSSASNPPYKARSTGLPNGTPLRKLPSPLATHSSSPTQHNFGAEDNDAVFRANASSSSSYSHVSDQSQAGRAAAATNLSTAIYKLSAPASIAVPTNTVNPQPNANTRLHQKIMMHVEANKEYKQRTAATNPSAAALPPGTALPHPGTTAPHPGTTTTSRRRSGGGSPGRTIFTSPQVQGDTPYTIIEQSRPVPPSALQQKPTITTGSSANREQQMKSPNTEGSPPQIGPRSLAVEIAAPPINLRRMHGSRRRLPLSDMIMHKKIAETLKKTISSGQLPSPIRDSSPQRFTPSPPTLPRPKSPSSPLPPAPPYYMKAWQASEIAKSGNTATEAMAVEQAPVTAQELPPRLPARSYERTTPERPPKLKATPERH